MFYPLDCDVIGSEIFSLLDQFHDLYTKQYIKLDVEESTSSTESSNSDTEESSSSFDTEESSTYAEETKTSTKEKGTGIETEDIERTPQTDGETSGKVPEKRVHFDDELKDGFNKEDGKDSVGEKKSVRLVRIGNQDIDLDEIKDKLEDKRKQLEREFEREVERHRGMQEEIEEMETVSGRYENRMHKHYVAIGEMNKWGDLLCQRIADYLCRLQRTEKLFNKSVKKLKLDLFKLLPKQREQKSNEYRIIAVRNLMFKLETTERNVRRLTKAINAETVLIEECEFLLNPMTVT